MVHSVPLADVLAGVGFLRPLLNRLFANPHTLELCDKSYKAPSSSTPRKHDEPTCEQGGDSRFERASAGRMLPLELN